MSGAGAGTARLVSAQEPILRAGDPLHGRGHHVLHPEVADPAVGGPVLSRVVAAGDAESGSLRTTVSERVQAGAVAAEVSRAAAAAEGRSGASVTSFGNTNAGFAQEAQRRGE